MQNASFFYECTSYFCENGKGLQAEVIVKPENIQAQALIINWLVAIMEEKNEFFKLEDFHLLKVCFYASMLNEATEEWRISTPFDKEIEWMSEDLKSAILADVKTKGRATEAFIWRTLNSIKS